MPTARTKVIGDRELIANLRGVSQAVTGKPLDDLMVLSMTPMHVATIGNARRLRQPGTQPRGGHLDEGVALAKVEARGKYYRVYWIGFIKRARYIAHLVEFGTAPHYQPRRGIHHPGARPKPFFRSAYEQNRDGVLTTFSAGAWALIQNFALMATVTRRIK